MNTRRYYCVTISVNHLLLSSKHKSIKTDSPSNFHVKKKHNTLTKEKLLPTTCFNLSSIYCFDLTIIFLVCDVKYRHCVASCFNSYFRFVLLMYTSIFDMEIVHLYAFNFTNRKYKIHIDIQRNREKIHYRINLIEIYTSCK